MLGISIMVTDPAEPWPAHTPTALSGTCSLRPLGMAVSPVPSLSLLSLSFTSIKIETSSMKR